jgi:hypothetical protein
MGRTTDMDDRATRRHRRRAATAALAVVALALVAAACTSTPPAPSLEQLKRTEFGNQALAEADQIGLGLAQPVLEFTVEDSPPSIFVNYVVPDERAADFAALVDLPPGFSLAKVRILDSDPEPRYWLSLNVYRVSGITVGLRAEWSTYVDDGLGNPRFMIVRARAAEGSVDPLGPLAPPEPFQHVLDPGGVIRTDMNRTTAGLTGPVLTSEPLFNSTITLPDPAERELVRPTREWVAANDFIYWLNGVNDRTFHNATAHSAQLISVDLADVTLADSTEWVPFIDPVPGHVLVYLGPIEFMIGPWWNVTEPDGRVDPATRSSLLALKRQMYGGLSTLSALGVLGGTTEPIVQSTVESTEPSVRWHWRIPAEQLAAFAAAAGLPPGLTLAPIPLAEGEPAEHWLTLHVSRQSGATAGLRAEWSTSVDDGTGVRQLVLETRSDQRSLDPVSRFCDPYPVQHAVAGTTMSTSIGEGPTAFTSSFELPTAGSASTQVPDRRWVATSDLRYWSNGIGDRVYTDSTTLAPKLVVDPATVQATDGGRWAPFTAAAPDRVWVDQGEVGQITNPWWTLAP